MVMLDANAILRYLLDDNEEMASEAEKVIRSHAALVTIEVVAEVIYVLKRVYSIGREEIKCVLYAYKCVKKHDILTFDKKLKKLLANV